MKLTDTEKQDIIRFLDTNKPLPDKYRFLLFDDKREVELVWNGKTNEVCNVVLPFQTIEQVDEPRAEKGQGGSEVFGDLFDARGRQMGGWNNKLIWGDNNLILSSLKNGPLRQEIEKQGGIKLIYIDPPFDVGADFSMDIEVGDGGDTLTKKPNILEEIAYRDTWGNGTDSFISMIHERLVLMRDLLAEDGSIYLHCDWRVSGLLRMVLDEVFGASNFVNEVIWWYEGPQAPSPLKFGSKHDTIFRYARDIKRNSAYELKYFAEEPFDPDKYKMDSNGRYYYTIPKGDYTDKSIQRMDAEGRVEWTKNGKARIKKFLEISKNGKLLLKPKKIPDVWEITSLGLAASSKENLSYPTQKPEALLERIIKASTKENDLVMDLFVGSGTTAAVAERLGRKWIVSDLGKFSIHTARKRMIGVQRNLKADGQDYRAFEILNLGKYERQHFVGVNPDLREEEKRLQLEAKEVAFLDLILNAYRAEKTDGFNTFHGKKAGRLVAVGPVNLPVTRLFVEEIILECRKLQVTKVDILGFEFEMGLFPNVQVDAREKGIDLALKYIPADVFDKRAIEKNQVVFHDVAYIEVKPHMKGSSVAIELTDFSVFYSQDAAEELETKLKKGKSMVRVRAGQVEKVSKDKKGILSREILTKSWTDWIDYWSVDFDYESKREIIRVPEDWDPDAQGHLPAMEPDQQNLASWKEVWTGDYIFENEWQSFRTKKDRSLEFKSVYQECEPGRKKIAVKVVDIFGNDTMTIIDVTVPGKGSKGKK